MSPESAKPAARAAEADAALPREGAEGASADLPPEELGGPAGPEPTRFGDWERRGRCIDF